MKENKEEQPEEFAFEALLGDNNGSTDNTTVRRERRPRGPNKRAAATVTKESIKTAIELANMGIILADTRMGLNEIEIVQLTEAWYDLAKQYPSVGKYLVVGQRLGVWGNLLFIHYQIISKRLAFVEQDRNKARSTRTASGNDGQRQNDVSTPLASIV